VNRAGIIAANPLPDYLRNRGFSLHPAGSNFVTNACPLKEHQKSHRCVTIDTAQGLWHCNDHERGGTIIDWEALEKRSNRPKRCDNSASDLTERIRRQPGGKSPQRIATPTKRANCFSKDFRQRRPDDAGGWIWNIQGITRVLYRLPDVLKTETICVTEGEKDADNLRALGFTATTNPLGAGKWRDEHSETLRGKTVLIFGDVGDPDQKGERHTEIANARQVAEWFPRCFRFHQMVFVAG